VHQGDDVEALMYGIGVSNLLVAAVPLVGLVPHHRERKIGMRLPITKTMLESAVLRGVVDDEDLTVIVAQNCSRESIQDWRQGGLSVVRHDED